MNILAFDCSGDVFRLSLKTDNFFEEVLGQDGKHSEFFSSSIENLLTKAKILPKDLDVVAVCLGPGSFTGIRVAVATAKAFAVSLEVKLIVFDSFELLAFNGKTIDRKRVCVVDGFSHNVFVGGALDADCVDIEYLKAKITCDTQLCCNDKVFDKIGMGDYVEPKNDMMGLVLYLIEKKRFVLVDDLIPVYLRLSQAELEKEKKNDKA